MKSWGSASVRPVSASPAPRPASTSASRPGTIQPVRPGSAPPARPAAAAGARPGIPAGRPGVASGSAAAGSWGGKGSGPVQPQSRPPNTGAQTAAQTAALKRPAAIEPAGPAAKKPLVSSAAAAAPMANAKLTVTTQSTRKDEIGIQTLLGDYSEEGTNHGRKFYKKIQAIPGHQDIKVFLYFWDSRDGPDFSGWWFGDQLGGTQVWARSAVQSPQPPRVGWKIPWDAASPEAGILFVDAYKAAAATVTPAGKGAAAAPAAAGKGGKTGAAAAPASAAAKGAAAAAPTAAGKSATPAAAQPVSAVANEPQVKKATTQVDAAVKASDLILAKFKVQATDKATEAVLKAAEESVKKQQATLMEVQKTLTEEIAAVRKAGGATSSAVIAELTKLSTKTRNAQVSIATELAKVKPLLQKATVAAAKTKEDEKKKEVTDSKDFQSTLPAVQELVSAAEDAVEAIILMASPLISEPPEPDSEILKKALEEIETSAKDAQDKILEARKQIGAKQGNLKNYATETKKTATVEYSALQTKLAEAQKKLTPYRNFKKDFQGRVAAKKSLQEVSDKLMMAELDIEKASIMTSASDAGQMSEDEIVSAEKLLAPANTAIGAAVRLIEQKDKGADAAMREELQQLRARGMAARTKIVTVQNQLKEQKQSHSARQVASQAAEKVDAAEAEMAKCQEAEMPFLKGIEVLPPDESTKAIGDSEAAAAATEKALNQASAFLKLKIAEAERFSSKTLSKSTVDELKQVQTRVDSLSKKLTDFKKETSDRKTAAIMAEVVDAIKLAEKKVALFSEASKPLCVESLADVVVEAVSSAAETVKTAALEATTALSEARKVLQGKQKEAKGEAVSTLGKLTTRLNQAQADLAKHQKAAINGDKLIKGKQTVADESEKMKQAEGQVEKVEVLVGPDLSDEAAAQLGDTIVLAEKALKDSAQTIEAHIAGAVAPVKAALTELKERNKKSAEHLAKILGQTKDLRERVLGEAYVREGNKKTQAVEAALEKVSEAELPFLKGIEILPLQEASLTLAASEEAAAEVSAALTEARNFAASKNLELKQFSKEAAVKLLEEFAKLTERINVAANKLTQFRKDTESRKKTAQVQELGEKVDATEEAVTKFATAVEPFGKEDADAMPADEAQALHEKIAELAKVAQERADDTRLFFANRQKDAKGNPTLTEMVLKQQVRINEVNKAFAAAKKVYADHEQKYVAKRLLQEAEKLMNDLEAAVKKATDASAALLEHKGEEFLVATSIETLATALREELKNKSIDQAALFASIGGKDQGLSEENFLNYVAKAPETLGKEELGFSEERRKAMFKQLDKDGDGFVSLAEFQAAFQKQYVCVRGISITDVLEISKSKTVGKLELKEVVNALGEQITDEAAGMLRVECRIGERSGWVTMKGNQGTTYLEPWTTFSAYSLDLDATVMEQGKELIKVSQFLKVKSAEIANKVGETSGPMAEARTELNKLRPKISLAQNTLENLKKKIIAAKKDFAVREQAEKIAHIEAKEQKVANEITSVSAVLVEATEAVSKKLEEAIAPLTSLEADKRDSFATPASTLDEAEKLLSSVKESALAAKASIKEQLPKLGATTTGPLARAKPEMTKMLGRVDVAVRKALASVDTIRKACATIASSRAPQVANALREDVQKRGITLDKLFEELASGERIPEEAFRARIQALAGVELTAEQAVLIARKVEAGGICRRKFLAFLQQYYIVVKAIAMTDEFDIGKAKTLRKAENEELVEVLEGQSIDEKLGMTRIRCKSLSDGLEGWVTIKGNQGTPFLKEVEKPFYVCHAEVSLNQDVKGDGAEVRKIRPDEVLELIEGPRAQAVARVVRIRVTANLDKATGWLTVRDKFGAVFAEADLKTYTCMASVALTDNQDMKDCKVVRKLVVGELINVTEGPVVDGPSGVSRVKGKCLSDGAEGWLTTKGNAGTVYAEVSAKHYTVVQEVPLQKRFQTAGAETVRALATGEVVQVLEGPKEEVSNPEVRAKVRAVLDGVVGWVSVTKPAVLPWKAIYKCLVATPLQDVAKAEGSTTIREVAVGEILELIEGPVEDGKALRLKGRSAKDGAIGWATIRDEDGKKVLSC